MALGSRGFNQLDGIAGRIINEDLLPPFPIAISLWNRHPARRNFSTVAENSTTSIWIRFQPPGIGIWPSGIACPVPLPPGD
jgi:hypothetical protein